MPFIIEHENDFFKYLVANGVGANDTVEGASPRSYISYLRSAAKILNCDISAQLFPNKNKADWESVCDCIKQDQQHAQYATRTREHAVTAMRHYFNFVMENRR